jgi:hypothetical protein
LQIAFARYDGAMRSLCALIALGLLAACAKSDNDPGPGGVTVGEAKALDQAADTLDKRRMPAAALRPPASAAAQASAAP